MILEPPLIPTAASPRPRDRGALGGPATPPPNERASAREPKDLWPGGSEGAVECAARDRLASFCVRGRHRDPPDDPVAVAEGGLSAAEADEERRPSGNNRPPVAETDIAGRDGRQGVTEQLDVCGGGRRRERAHGLEVAAPLPRGRRAGSAGSLLSAVVGAVAHGRVACWSDRVFAPVADDGR